MEEKEVLVNKLKILRNPCKKSAKELLKSLVKPGYFCTIEQINDVIVRIEKRGVPMSLNGKSPCPKLIRDALRNDKIVNAPLKSVKKCCFYAVEDKRRLLLENDQ